MHALNFFELQSYSKWIFEHLKGAQLQNFWTDGTTVVLELYRQGSSWLVFDLDRPSPQMALLEQAPPIKKKSKPITLFLNSHAKNLRLTEMMVDREKGRVVRLHFGSDGRECRIEVFLIPRQSNFMVMAGEKKVYLEKPRELPPSQVSEPTEAVKENWQERGREWWAWKFARSSPGLGGAKEKDPLSQSKRDLEKKRKALAALLQQAEGTEQDRWRQLGEHLKSSSEVPEELTDFFNKKKSVSWNREHAFQKAKDLVRKKQGTLARIQQLQEQIHSLQSDVEAGLGPASKPTKSIATEVLQRAESKGRKLQLPEGLEAVIGKSAKDNLATLRQARAWDLWFHLRDYPGAHAVVFRQKNQSVPLSVIQQVAEWMIRQMVSKKQIPEGSKYDVVVVECRHVRPIKGSKAGLVTYQNAQTYTFASRA